MFISWPVDLLFHPVSSLLSRVSWPNLRYQLLDSWSKSYWQLLPCILLMFNNCLVKSDIYFISVQIGSLRSPTLPIVQTWRNSIYATIVYQILVNWHISKVWVDCAFSDLTAIHVLRTLITKRRCFGCCQSFIALTTLVVYWVITHSCLRITLHYKVNLWYAKYKNVRRQNTSFI